MVVRLQLGLQVLLLELRHELCVPLPLLGSLEGVGDLLPRGELRLKDNLWLCLNELAGVGGYETRANRPRVRLFLLLPLMFYVLIMPLLATVVVVRRCCGGGGLDRMLPVFSASIGLSPMVCVRPQCVGAAASVLCAHIGLGVRAKRGPMGPILLLVFAVAAAFVEMLGASAGTTSL